MNEIETGGLDWEKRAQVGWFSAFGNTLRKSLFEPSRFFETVPPQGDFVSPMLYGVICMTVGGIFGTLYFAFLKNFIISFSSLPIDTAQVVFSSTFFVIFFTLSLIFSPFLNLINLFMMAGIYHLFLMITGGAKKGFEATFRVVAYSQGAQLLQFFPILGSLVAMVWSCVLFIIGFKKVHQCSTGQSVLAVFLPLILFCGFLFVLFLGFALLMGAFFKGAYTNF